MEKAKKPASDRHRKPQGPRLYMTDREYATVKKIAAYHGVPVVAHVREQVLAHDVRIEVSGSLVNKVRRTGRWLNKIVRDLRKGREFQVFGFKKEGVLHVQDVRRMLAAIKETLSEVPTGRRAPLQEVGRGAGARRMRGALRCTREEWEHIRQQAAKAGISQAAYIRAVTLSRPIGTADHQELTIELARIESNLHQLSRFNRGGAGIVWEAGRLAERIPGLIREVSSGRKRRQR